MRALIPVIVAALVLQTFAVATKAAASETVILRGHLPPRCEVRVFPNPSAGAFLKARIERDCNAPHQLSFRIAGAVGLYGEVRFAGSSRSAKEGRALFRYAEPVAGSHDLTIRFREAPQRPVRVFIDVSFD